MDAFYVYFHFWNKKRSYYIYLFKIFFMNKEEYKIYIRDVVQDITNRIDELRQRSNGVSEKVKAEFEEKVHDLIKMRDDLLRKLEGFDALPENKWEEAKTDFATAIDFLRQGFQKLFSILSQ